MRKGRREVGPVIAAALAAALAVAAPAANAATYHVAFQDPRAADANPGTEDRPFLSIQRAVDLAGPGDRVVVKAGVYRERLLIRRAGEPQAPLVIEAERGSGGERLSIIDPSVPVGAGWSPAPEVGEGVWKRPDMPFEPGEMTAGGRHLARIMSRAMAPDGLKFLAEPAEADCRLQYPNAIRQTVKCWDGIEAAYGTLDGVTYLRFRRGDDPNGMDLRAAPAEESPSAIGLPSVRFDRAAYVVFRGFHVRGGFAQIALANASHHVAIRENLLTTGSVQLAILGGSFENLIEANEITLDDFAGYKPGAWGSGTTYEAAVRQRIYSVPKILSSWRATGIVFRKAGDRNRVVGNFIHDSLVGIGLLGDPEAPFRGTEIAANTIRDMSSVGIAIVSGHTETEIHHNLLANCNIAFRWHQLNEPKEAARVTYIHHNRSWNPAGLGAHIYCHFWLEQPSTYRPVFWDYQNSYAGGRSVLVMSPYGIAKGGLPNAHFVNDIFSAQIALHVQAGFRARASYVGSFDYNLLAETVPGRRARWMGRHNVRTPAPVWDPAAMPSFEVPANLPAAGRGLDLSRPFTLQKKDYPALPGMTPSAVPGAARTMGASDR